MTVGEHGCRLPARDDFLLLRAADRPPSVYNDAHTTSGVPALTGRIHPIATECPRVGNQCPQAGPGDVLRVRTDDRSPSFHPTPPLARRFAIVRCGISTRPISELSADFGELRPGQHVPPTATRRAATLRRPLARIRGGTYADAIHTPGTRRGRPSVRGIGSTASWIRRERGNHRSIERFAEGVDLVPVWLPYIYRMSLY